MVRVARWEEIPPKFTAVRALIQRAACFFFAVLRCVYYCMSIWVGQCVHVLYAQSTKGTFLVCPMTCAMIWKWTEGHSVHGQSTEQFETKSRFLLGWRLRPAQPRRIFVGICRQWLRTCSFPKSLRTPRLANQYDFFESPEVCSRWRGIDMLKWILFISNEWSDNLNQ